MAIQWGNAVCVMGCPKNTSTQGRWKVHDYFLLLLCKSSIWFTGQHIFKIIVYFFNTSKRATIYVISFEVYDDLIGQKTLKLWRQESWPFGPGWAAHITSIRSWTFCLPWSTGLEGLFSFQVHEAEVLW